MDVTQGENMALSLVMPRPVDTQIRKFMDARSGNVIFSLIDFTQQLFELPRSTAIGWLFRLKKKHQASEWKEYDIQGNTHFDNDNGKGSDGFWYSMTLLLSDFLVRCRIRFTDSVERERLKQRAQILVSDAVCITTSTQIMVSPESITTSTSSSRDMVAVAPISSLSLLPSHQQQQYQRGTVTETRVSMNMHRVSSSSRTTTATCTINPITHEITSSTSITENRQEHITIQQVYRHFVWITEVVGSLLETEEDDEECESMIEDDTKADHRPSPDIKSQAEEKFAATSLCKTEQEFDQHLEALAAMHTTGFQTDGGWIEDWKRVTNSPTFQVISNRNWGNKKKENAGEPEKKKRRFIKLQ